MRKGRADADVESAKAVAGVDLDGTGNIDLSSGSGFLDHMLHAFSRTGQLDLEAEAPGSYWGTIALGKALGMAMGGALGDRSGIRRYGFASVPMDEALAQVSLDFSGRSYLVFKGELFGDLIGDLEAQRVKVFLESLSVGGKLTLHVKFYGENDHHMVESVFKALGLAVREAVSRDGSGVPSTKGVI
jgi:imidazoleglycerol-phosphate dehydratase